MFKIMLNMTGPQNRPKHQLRYANCKLKIINNMELSSDLGCGGSQARRQPQDIPKGPQDSPKRAQDGPR